MTVRNVIICIHFNGFPSMPGYTTKAVKKYGIRWELRVRRVANRYAVFLFHTKNIDGWPVEVDSHLFVITKNGRSHCPRGAKTVHNDILPFTMECHVAVLRMHGYPREKIVSFDAPKGYLTDVVLVVEDEKFHVSKVFLATHSPVFEQMFFGLLAETKAEIPLKGIDPEMFQDFLELLHCHQSVTPHNIEGLLFLADYFHVETAKKTCEKFLTDTSAIGAVHKMVLAEEFDMPKLVPKCLEALAKAKTISEIEEMCPDDVTRCSEQIKNLLINKMFSLNSITHS